MIFHGTCACGPILAGNLYEEALSEIFAEKPNLSAAERLLRQSVTLDPTAFFVYIELGNLYLKQGSRENALQAYSDALHYVPADPMLRQPIQAQIERISAQPPTDIEPLRDPFLE